MSAPSDEACRIDVWLWRARFCKTRALAARIVEEGQIWAARGGAPEVRIDKASRLVRVGDRLRLDLDDRQIGLRVAGLGLRRGPASEARELYEMFGDVRRPASGPGQWARETD